MELKAGSRIGPYEILTLLGAGGMGQVYRARDTKLQREVAIKILPEAFAGDPDRLARFTREAQMLAVLNHPSIAQIHGFEDAAGHRALVMELVEGEDLAERLSRGPIPIAEALPIARQIAEALEAAHEHGIVHRDLKPANIKLRPDGTVKVLDFGLAKALSPDTGSSNAMNSPTLTARATQMGVVLGTAAYMAPEQAKGRPVDRRADLWAFGAVVYEVLTGRRAFEGGDVTEVLASVIKDTPALDALPPDTPPAIRRLLYRCLQKDPRERIADASTARLEIAEAAATGGASAISASHAPPPGRTRGSGVAWVSAIAAALVTGLAVWWLKPAPVAPPSRPLRLTQTLPDGAVWTRPALHVLAISPDGARLAYAANSRLFVRELDQFDAAPLGNVVDPSEVFFSPDGQWVGHYTAGRLWKAPVGGGTPVLVCPTTQILGASWTLPDWIVFTVTTGIMRVPAEGGTPELIVKSAAGERFGSVQLLSNGTVALFSQAGAGSGWDAGEIAVERLDTHERKVVVRGGTDARYLPMGQLVFGQGTDLMAVAFDAATLSPRGTPQPFIRDVAGSTVSLTGAYQYAISDSGTVAYLSGSGVGNSQLVQIDRAGREAAIAVEPGVAYPRVSPDGSRLAFSAIVAGNSDIYIRERGRDARSRLTFDPARDTAPVWTPDSKRVVYASSRDGAQSLYWQAADGTGTAERVTTAEHDQYPYAVTPDGRMAIYIELHPSTNYDIYAVPLSGDRKPIPLLVTPFDERRPALSPDGRWMVYQSNESGQFELFIRPFPNVEGGRWQVSAGGGSSPLWAHNGREIFYRSGQTIQRVDVQMLPNFSVSQPAQLIQMALPVDAAGMMYSVTPDDKQAIIVRQAGGAGPVAYRLELNAIEEFRRRVAAGAAPGR